MARKPKKQSSARDAEPQWQRENQSTQTSDRVRWFSAHEYTTSADTLRTPKAEEKPGIGAPTARQERDAVSPETDAVTRRRQRRPRNSTIDERPTQPRRRSSARPRRNAASRNRGPRSAH